MIGFDRYSNFKPTYPVRGHWGKGRGLAFTWDNMVIAHVECDEV